MKLLLLGIAFALWGGLGVFLIVMDTRGHRSFDGASIFGTMILFLEAVVLLLCGIAS